MAEMTKRDWMRQFRSARRELAAMPQWKREAMREDVQRPAQSHKGGSDE